MRVIEGRFTYKEREKSVAASIGYESLWHQNVCGHENVFVFNKDADKNKELFYGEKNVSIILCPMIMKQKYFWTAIT